MLGSICSAYGRVSTRIGVFQFKLIILRGQAPTKIEGGGAWWLRNLAFRKIMSQFLAP
jgi:hypothetical protein